jgi:glycosyltransferase involved in cell wall biosynthesis
MNRRVLFIAYLFAPIVNSGTQRPLKFAKYLPSLGWDPVIITAARVGDYPIDPRLLNDIPAGAQVHRVPMLNDRIGEFAGTLGLGVVNRERIAQGISWRLRKRWQHPDIYALWRPTARRTAMRLYRDIGFDAIYATGYPWTSLLIGMDLSMMTGRPLIADFRDPWAADDYEGRTAGRHDDDARLEHDVVRQAASVVCVSATMTAQMMAAHPDVPARKFVTIPNGFDPADVRAAPAWPHLRFRIVYTGVWKPGYGLDALYDVIGQIARANPRALANVEVIAAGFEPGPAHRRGLSEHIDEIGVLSHNDAVALMRSADILFLQNAQGASQQHRLPGKMFEYLATGRPVLAVTDPDGEAGRLIHRVGGGVVVSPDDRDRLREIIAVAIRRGRLDTPPQDRALLRAFERPALAKTLAAVLASVTRQPAAA